MLQTNTNAAINVTNSILITVDLTRTLTQIETINLLNYIRKHLPNNSIYINESQNVRR